MDDRIEWARQRLAKSLQVAEVAFDDATGRVLAGGGDVGVFDRARVERVEVVEDGDAVTAPGKPSTARIERAAPRPRITAEGIGRS